MTGMTVMTGKLRSLQQLRWGLARLSHGPSKRATFFSYDEFICFHSSHEHPTNFLAHDILVGREILPKKYLNKNKIKKSSQHLPNVSKGLRIISTPKANLLDMGDPSPAATAPAAQGWSAQLESPETALPCR